MEVDVVAFRKSQEFARIFEETDRRAPLRTEVYAEDLAALDDREQIAVGRTLGQT